MINTYQLADIAMTVSSMRVTYMISTKTQKKLVERMVYLVMKPSFYWHLPHFVTDAHYCTYAESSAYKSGYKHDVSESQSYDSIFRRTGERACIPYSEVQS